MHFCTRKFQVWPNRLQHGAPFSEFHKYQHSKMVQMQRWLLVGFFCIAIENDKMLFKRALKPRFCQHSNIYSMWAKPGIHSLIRLSKRSSPLGILIGHQHMQLTGSLSWQRGNGHQRVVETGRGRNIRNEINTAPLRWQHANGSPSVLADITGLNYSGSLSQWDSCGCE